MRVAKTTREERGSKEAIADEQNANKKIAQKVFVPKAPLCKGSSRGAGEGLFCKIFRFLQSHRHFPMKMPPPNLRSKFIHQGRLMVEPVYGWLVTLCMAGRWVQNALVRSQYHLGLCPKLKYPPLYGGIVETHGDRRVGSVFLFCSVQIAM